MGKIGILFSIKTSHLFIGLGLVIIIVLGIVIYMKKRNSEQS